MPMSRVAESPNSAVETRTPYGASRCFAYAAKLAISRPFGTLVLPG